MRVCYRVGNSVKSAWKNFEFDFVFERDWIFFFGGERWINLTKPCHLIIGPMRSPYAKYYPSVIRSRSLQKVFGGWMVGGGGGGYHSEYRVLL